jgi:ubiquinol-cytochrome c reductase cytochrome c1 subunit
MAKARAGFHGPVNLGLNQLFRGTGGPEYIHALMVGYEEPPACAADFESDGYYNRYFSKGAIPDACKNEEGHSTIEGSWIAMPQPLSDDQVTYADGTPATIDQMATDVASFLMWTAEPKLMDRKNAGFVSVIFLAFLATLLFLTNKRIWAGVKGKKKHA